MTTTNKGQYIYPMKSEREHIYLAALLHDIGKFYQRADNGSVNGSKYLKTHCKDESSFCPQSADKSSYTHKHVLWTAQFIEDFSPVFKTLVGDELTDLSAKDNLMNLAAGHHLKNEQLSEWGQIIKEADCLSSGMDRESTEALRDSQDESVTGWDAFKKKRMIPILQTIGRDEESADWMHLPVGKMQLTQSSFPKKEFTQAPDYNGLWCEFVGEFKYIQANTYRAFSETLLSLLYKYTTTIPSSTINFPDVSLYDHLKTTAAIAVCLYDCKKEGAATDDAPFLLIGADFSGIQNYIYQIVSKHAGKNLKGRSYYLRILSDAVVRYLLKELNLFQANVIYNSGGGFYLLAPNTLRVKEKLDDAIQHIEKKLFEAHGIALYVAIDSVALSKDALLHRNEMDLGKVWGELFAKRDKRKQTKFLSLLQNDYANFFTPMMMGGNAKRDTITGEELLPDETAHNMSGMLLKELTAQQIEIGKKLREADLLVVKEGEPLPYWANRTHIAPANLGFTYYFLNSEELGEMKTQLNASADAVSVITMNGKEGNCDFLHSLDGVNNIYGLDFYGGNEVDRRGMPTFEEMCENKNLSRLGVLRMDVDNLGLIFQKGIPAERATLSRYAALSRSFDFFFSGYLNTIWREVAPENSFIIYSGGDDVFIVGSWDVAIQLAERIKNDFKAFACGNPKFTLSGGIAILSPKYPIMKGAEESAHEEHAAKSHVCGNQSKDSVSFMNMPLNWEHEYPVVKALKDTLYGMLYDGLLPKSLLSKLMAHHANANIKNHTITSMKTYWMLTYDLSRMKGRHNDTAVNSLLENCIKEVCDKSCGRLNGHSIISDYHPLELWTFAARWAELEYRRDKE